MESKRRVKYFNEIEYNNAISSLNKKLPKARELKSLIASFDGLKSLKSIEDWLYISTKFSNPEFAADSIGLKSEYIKIKQLLQDIQLKNYNKTLTAVDKKVAEQIRENTTSYFSEEEEEVIKKADKLMQQLNDLDLPARMAISKNRANNFTFIPILYSQKKSFMRR